MGGLQAFREMLAQSLTEPPREMAGRLMSGALNRSLGKGKYASIKPGRPEFPSNTIFDYRDFEADPKSHLERKDLALPKSERGFEDILPAFRSPNTVNSILEAAQRGADKGGHLWYNTAPIHDFAYKYAPEADVKGFLSTSAPFSVQTSVDKEIKQGAFANYFMKKYGRMPYPDEMMELEKSILGGGGSIVDKLGWAHEANQGELGADRTAHGSILGKAKLIPYNDARGGNDWNAVMDSWMLNGLGIPPNVHAKPKGAAELGTKMLAERSGMLPTKFQAAAWTGLQGDTRPYSLLLDEAVQNSAKNVGKDPHEHMADILSGRDYIRNEPQQFAEGGLAQYIRMRLRQEAKNASYGPMKNKLEQWGKERISDPFNVSPSGRKAVALGDDKVVKIVGDAPRGFREQEIEGDPMAGLLLPQLHYRSPNSELTVLERIMNTDPDFQRNFINPVGRAYDRNESGAPYRSRHRDDPMMSMQMQKQGLGPFQNFDILGGDFIHPGHWGFRGNYRGPTQSSAALLDAGALDPDLTKKAVEEQYRPQFTDVSHLRADYLTKILAKNSPYSPALVEHSLHSLADTDPRNLIWKFPDTDLRSIDPLKAAPQRENPGQMQFDPKFSRGGQVAMRLARAAAAFKPKHDDSESIYSYAGGGEVRNWLRGVKGSGIDKALEQLKSRYQPMAEGAIGMRNEAMQKWIDRNLGNYIVRQLGTADDPLLQHMQGTQNFLPDRDQANLVRRIPAAQVPERIGIPSWLGGVDDAKNQTGYQGQLDKFKAESPLWLQKLIEQDTPRNTKAAEVLKAASEKLAKAGGNRDLVKAATEHYNKAVGAGALGDYRFEGPDPIMLHDLDPQAWDRHMREPMQGMMDYLSQNYTPEQLNKISVPDAMKGSIDWHEALAKKKAEMMKDPWLGTSVHKEYPTGFKWVKFDPEKIPKAKLFGEKNEVLKSHEDSAAAEEAIRAGLEQEGNQMGHCVGGYCDDVLSGNSHIYSLRDPQGQPHVTVEAIPPQRSRSMDSTDEQRSEDMRAFLPDIAQIKGKGDKKPADQYLPYVQDFVRSGKWGGVGDLHNTGLQETKSLLGHTHYLLPAERKQFEKISYPFQKPNKGVGQVDYDIPQDFQPGPIPIPGEQGFAEGGLVSKDKYSDEEFFEEMLDLLAA